MGDADDMQLIDQEESYRQCGVKIKSDLLSGNAVVLFACKQASNSSHIIYTTHKCP
jgi:hypothetical protein